MTSVGIHEPISMLLGDYTAHIDAYNQKHQRANHTNLAHTSGRNRTGSLCGPKLMHDIDMSRGSWWRWRRHTHTTGERGARYTLQAVFVAIGRLSDEVECAMQGEMEMEE